MQSVNLPSEPGSSGQVQPLLSGPSPGRVREGARRCDGECLPPPSWAPRPVPGGYVWTEADFWLTDPRI